MQIKRDDLLAMLDITKLAVAGSEQVEQLSHFIFTGEEIITFNNRIGIFYPFETPWECTVRSDLFYKQLTKFESNDLNIEVTGPKMSIIGLNEKATMSVVIEKDEEIFNELRSIQNEHVDAHQIEVPEDFTKALLFTAFSASNNPADGVLTCCSVNGNMITSCDNYRASRYTMQSDLGVSFLVDHAIAAQLDKFLVETIAVGRNYLTFYCDNMTISARQVTGTYPDFNIFDYTAEGSLRLPESIVDAIDFVSVILAKEQPLERVANIDIKEGNITVSVTKDTESSEKTVKLADDEHGASMSFTVNVEFLKSIVAHTHTMEYEWKHNRGVFSHKNFQHVIRIKNTEGEE